MLGEDGSSLIENIHDKESQSIYSKESICGYFMNAINKFKNGIDILYIRKSNKRKKIENQEYIESLDNYIMNMYKFDDKIPKKYEVNTGILKFK